ncbi:MAG: hypothetical protein HYU74_13250 [Dechloromonas sp.]|nr:hypothetical protein [Dechloromonas sp.]
MLASNTSLNNPAPGIMIGRNDTKGIEYIGTDQALVEAGILQPAWLTNLGGMCRQIVRLPNGGFQIVGEGKGNRLTNQHKESGAFSVSRKRDGTFAVFAHHHPDEYRRRKAEEDAKYEAEWEVERAKLQAMQEKETWRLAKKVHGGEDWPERWRNGVLYHVEQAEQLIVGRLVFTDFPDVRLTDDDIAQAKAAIAELRKVLASSRPRVRDRVQVSNVVSLDEYAYRNMKSG